MSKNDQNFDRKKVRPSDPLGPIRRNALASWGDYRGVKKLHFRDLHISSAYYGFKIVRFGISIGHEVVDPARLSSPLRGGRRIDFPKGDHRRPPAFSLWRFGEGYLEMLAISAIFAILSVLGQHLGPS